MQGNSWDILLRPGLIIPSSAQPRYHFYMGDAGVPEFFPCGFETELAVEARYICLRIQGDLRKLTISGLGEQSLHECAANTPAPMALSWLKDRITPSILALG